MFFFNIMLAQVHFSFPGLLGIFMKKEVSLKPHSILSILSSFFVVHLV